MSETFAFKKIGLFIALKILGKAFSLYVNATLPHLRTGVDLKCIAHYASEAGKLVGVVTNQYVPLVSFSDCT